MENLFNIPYDLTFIILLNLKNLKSFRSVNRKMKTIIDSIFLYFSDVYSSLEKNWINNKYLLVNKLVQTDNIDGLIFLLNNYNNVYNNIDKLIAYYAGVYNKKILTLGNAYVFKNNIIRGAAYGGHFQLIKDIYDITEGNIKLSRAVNEAIKYLNFKLASKLLELKVFTNSEINSFAETAAYTGNLEYVNFLFTNYHAINLTRIGEIAASKKYDDLRLWAYNHGADLNAIAVAAIEKANDIATLNWAYNIGNVNPNFIAYAAASVGNLEILIDSINRGADINYYMIMRRAVVYQDLQFVVSLIELGANDFETMANYAALTNKIDILNYAIEQGGEMISYFDVVKNAVIYGNIDLVKNILDNHNIDNIQKLGNTAASFGHLEILKYFISLGANDYAYMVKKALKHDHLNVIKYLLESGLYININNIAIAAVKNHNDKILIYALMKGANNYNVLKSLSLLLHYIEGYKIITK